MKHLFKPRILKWIVVLLVVVLAVKLVWLAVEMTLLPTVGVNQAEEVGGKSLYYRVELSSNKVAAPKKVEKRKPAGSIRDIELLAIYNAADTTVVTVMYKQKTKVLARGEEINGFILEGAGSNYAIFSKKGKNYRVDLIKGKKGTGSGSIRTVMPATSSDVAAASRTEGEVTDAGDHKIVDRSLLKHYAKNMDDIYKNIGIAEIKEGSTLKGFKITFVKRGSPFAKLGVRRGDIIKSINGQEINSYNSAFNMYKNIQNVDNLTLVIQRGKEEMELEYEIN
jgi:general secretion pathway protein C